jgi:hypothetical protein
LVGCLGTALTRLSFFRKCGARGKRFKRTRQAKAFGSTAEGTTKSVPCTLCSSLGGMWFRRAEYRGKSVYEPRLVAGTNLP